MSLIPALLTALGPAVLVVGLLLMRRHDGPDPSQVVVDGTVLRWEHRRIGSTVAPRELGSLPVVRFSTLEGRQVEGTPRWAADRGVYRSGHEVKVRYDSDNPTSFTVRQGWLDRPYAMLVVIGACLTFLTLVVPLLFRTLF